MSDSSNEQKAEEVTARWRAKIEELEAEHRRAKLSIDAERRWMLAAIVVAVLAPAVVALLRLAVSE